MLSYGRPTPSDRCVGDPDRRVGSHSTAYPVHLPSPPFPLSPCYSPAVPAARAYAPARRCSCRISRAPPFAMCSPRHDGREPPLPPFLPPSPLRPPCPLFHRSEGDGGGLSHTPSPCSLFLAATSMHPERRATTATFGKVAGVLMWISTSSSFSSL